MDTKNSETTRFYFQNTGRLPHCDNHKIKHLSVNKANKSIDIMCLVELNLNWRSHNAYSDCKTAVQNQFNSEPNNFTSTNTDISWHNGYQPGYFLIVVMNPNNSKIELKNLITN